MTISRVDRGFQVRVTRQGKQYTRFFRDTRPCPTEAATLYEEALAATLPRKRDNIGIKRSTSNEQPLHFVTLVELKGGKHYFEIRYRTAEGRWTHQHLPYSGDVDSFDEELQKAIDTRQRLHHAGVRKAVVSDPPTPEAAHRLAMQYLQDQYPDRYQELFVEPELQSVH